ncbi:murein biosynthesis integral membrane protein MurJ [Desulfotomaculum copahuensis]|uniref:Probable lipid II flippase MurJ n=1 Tax=Desulfotomaculum copahuensis TaxID=1838280 RepID=A0A1B7LHP5_9FIRM|nr:murein biosynthesis integral membrane protein MurJ [Desulfotomaculum copahuensis]OAT85778.1 murein biosynthesis integral membrane protein MurJ [Desulfotomaculum copahuensis]
MSTGKVIARATVVLAILNLLSKFLGIVRDQAVAYMFGATGITDAYLVAFNIPYTFFYIAIGALATVVVPVFTEYSAKGKRDEAWSLFNTVITILMIIFLLVTIVGILFAPFLVKITAPGLNPKIAALATQLTKMMLPILIVYGLSTIFQGLLNANQVFAISAFSTSVTNLTIIFSAFTLGAKFGINGLAFGSVLGFTLAALIQVPKLRKLGFHYKFSIDWSHPGIRKVLYLVMPVAVGTSMNQTYQIIDRILASGLGQGSISALNFANKLILMPVSFFAIAIGTAFYPTITMLAAEHKECELAGTVLRAVRTVALFALPASIGLFVMATPVVKLLFQHGRFDSLATQMTATALMLYTIGLTGQAVNIILTRAFYARQDTKTPVKLMGVTVLVNLIFSLLLIGPLKQGGLALANSIASLLNTAMLAYFLQKRMPGLWNKNILKFLVQLLLSSVFLALAVREVNQFAAGYFGRNGLTGLAIQVGISIIAGLVIFIASIFALKMDEASLVFSYARKLRQRVLLTRS